MNECCKKCRSGNVRVTVDGTKTYFKFCPVCGSERDVEKDGPIGDGGRWALLPGGMWRWTSRDVYLSESDGLSFNPLFAVFGGGRPAQKKVFCSECEYFREWSEPVCVHPENTKTLDTWRDRFDEFQRSPSKINANNDCKLWEAK